MHTALFAYVAARKANGIFVVRIDDTDPVRSEARWETEVLEALKYLGIDWDEGPGKGGSYEPYRQSERSEIYESAINQLKNNGFLYPCFCTEAEMNVQRAAARASGRPFTYDGRCFRLSEKEREKNIESGKDHVWRFHIDPDRLGEEVRFTDLVWGEQVFRTELIGDFVCMRGDGKPTYMLVSPLDDASMEITHIIRGADHLPNTPSQILLLKALGYDPPEFAHLPLITGLGGKKLSKRDSMSGLDDIRSHLPRALVNHLMLLGWTHPDGKEILGFDEIIESFSFERVSTSPSAHDPARLQHLEREHLGRMSPPSILSAWMDSVYSCSVQLNEEHLSTARRILEVVSDEVTSLEAVGRDVIPLVQSPDDETLRELFDRIDRDSALEVIKTILQTCGSGRLDIIEGMAKSVGKKQVYLPLRVALTGMTRGFELSRIISALTVEEVDERLNKSIEILSA